MKWYRKQCYLNIQYKRHFTPFDLTKRFLKLRKYLNLVSLPCPNNKYLIDISPVNYNPHNAIKCVVSIFKFYTLLYVCMYIRILFFLGILYSKYENYITANFIF